MSIALLLFNSVALADGHPLETALLAGEQDIAAQLIDAGIPPDFHINSNKLDELLPRSARMQDWRKDSPGYPLALAAAALGQTKVLAAIARQMPEQLHRADINNRTAINYAAQRGCLPCVELLLTMGQNPLQSEIQFPFSHTPLALAVRAGHHRTTKRLLAAIPTIRYFELYVTEQVWLSVYHHEHDIHVLQALLAAGVPPDHIARQGGTALIQSVINQNPAQVRLLLEHHAKADAHLYRGRSLLEWAAYYNERDATPASREIFDLLQKIRLEANSWRKDWEIEDFKELQRKIGIPAQPWPAQRPTLPDQTAEKP